MSELIPPGTDVIMRWAMNQRLAAGARPDEGWFRAFEPFDTMVAPARYVNAVTWPRPPGSITVVEPWTEEGMLEPMDRTLLAFVAHPALAARASMRVGEHFITRVSSLTHTPPPAVQLGDAVWDQHVVTLAHEPQQAHAAFPPALRGLLQSWGFTGHIEMRPGCAIVHYASLKPTIDHYARLADLAQQVVDAALRRS